MNNFNKGGQSFRGGRDKKRGFGGGSGRGRGGRGGDRSDMHRAVCSDCGKNCEVPFRPSGDKPVFCSDCFKKQGGGKSRDRGPRNFEDRNSRPSFNDKPSYQNRASVNTENYKAQFEELNLKLDKILKAITPVISKKTQETKTSDKIVATAKFSAKPKAKKIAKKATNKKKKKK